MVLTLETPNLVYMGSTFKHACYKFLRKLGFGQLSMFQPSCSLLLNCLLFKIIGWRSLPHSEFFQLIIKKSLGPFSVINDNQH